jgi:hypothetical protein
VLSAIVALWPEVITGCLGATSTMEIGITLMTALERLFIRTRPVQTVPTFFFTYVSRHYAKALDKLRSRTALLINKKLRVAENFCHQHLQALVELILRQ